MLTNASPFVVCTASAPNVARGYTNTGFNDWLLPSKDELNAMCNYSRNPATPAAPGVPCSINASPTTEDIAFASGAVRFRWCQRRIFLAGRCALGVGPVLCLWRTEHQQQERHPLCAACQGFLTLHPFTFASTTGVTSPGPNNWCHQWA